MANYPSLAEYRAAYGEVPWRRRPRSEMEPILKEALAEIKDRVSRRDPITLKDRLFYGGLLDDATVAGADADDVSEFRRTLESVRPKVQLLFRAEWPRAREGMARAKATEEARKKFSRISFASVSAASSADEKRSPPS